MHQSIVVFLIKSGFDLQDSDIGCSSGEQSFGVPRLSITLSIEVINESRIWLVAPSKDQTLAFA